MTLEPTTVRPLVESWSERAAAAWPADEEQEVVDAIVELSASVTPHVVLDQPLGAREQELLLARTLAYLQDALAQVAAGLRHQWRIDAPRPRTGSTEPALGLRSATLEELEALPGIDEALAERIARLLATRPDVTDLRALLAIDGIGPARLAALEASAYLDRPRPLLVSATTWAFALRPGIDTFLDVLEHGDLTVVHGDQSTAARRLQAPAASPAARLGGFVRAVAERVRRRASLVDGVIASEGLRWLDREAARRQRLGSLAPVTGGVLIGSAYVDAVEQIIEGATTSLDLMVFLGTATEGRGGKPGSLRLVEALEAAAARGVDVRVILDQDDRGEPYGSYWINRPLVQRLLASAVRVRLDDQDTLLHSKLLVADAAVVVVGSHNWTRAGLDDAHELSVVVDGAATAEPFARRFDALWDALPDVQ